MLDPFFAAGRREPLWRRRLAQRCQRRRKAPARPDGPAPATTAGDRLELLREEYALLSEGMEETYSRIGQFIALGTTVLGGAATYMATRQAVDINPAVAWVAPAVILAIYGVAVALAARQSSVAFQLRLVAGRLIALTGEPEGMLYYHGESIPAHFLSLRRGSKGYRILVATLILVIAAVFVYVLAASFVPIYRQSHLQASLFVLVYACLAAVVALGLAAVMQDLPYLYDRASERFSAGDGRWPQLASILAGAPRAWHLIAPRAEDLLLKSWLFWIGFIMALWVKGPALHPMIPVLFVTSPTPTPPAWTYLAIALSWFVIQEGLVQQAKYVWNDIRDREADRGFAGKRERPIASGRSSVAAAIVHMLVRWSAGLALGYLFDRRLFVLLVVVSATQVLYELWVKPRGASAPLLALVWLALSSSIRVLGGLLAAGADPLELRLGMFVTAMFLFGIGYIAAFFRIEGEYCKRKRERPRHLQSEYFVAHGRPWQRFGFIGLILCAGLLLFDAAAAAYTSLRPADQARVLLQRIVPVSDSVATTLEYLAAMLLVAGLAWALRGPVGRLLERLARRRRFTPVLLLLTVAAVAGPALHGAPGHRDVASSAAMLLLAILSAVTYETITYEQYKFVYLKENLGRIAGVWFRYLFDGTFGLPFPALLWATGRLATEKHEAVEEEWRRRSSGAGASSGET